MSIPKGISLRGYGDATSTTPGVVTHCRCYNNKGKEVGYIETYTIPNPDAMGHRWRLKDGSYLDVNFTNASDILNVQPVNADTVKAFPEASSYIANPNARLLILSGNHYKGSPQALKWEARGKLRCANYVEVRCVFLAIVQPNGFAQPIQCLGCHWFLGQN